MVTLRARRRAAAAGKPTNAENPVHVDGVTILNVAAVDSTALGYVAGARLSQAGYPSLGATLWGIMAATVVWAATQVDDPLSRYIHTDKMRHLLAFGAIGLCAGLLPTIP